MCDGEYHPIAGARNKKNYETKNSQKRLLLTWRSVPKVHTQ